jgi:pSer/pThr/pTyr-binding forkhead associated (FHA) protein
VDQSGLLAGQKRVRELMISKLIPLDGSKPVSITQDVTLVGRKRGVVDLYVDHPSISKLHCLIARTDGLLFFRDLGSTNGTKVNGQRVMRGALLPGDELAFAKVKYRVHLGPGEPEVGSDERTEMIAAYNSQQHDRNSEFGAGVDDDSAEMDAGDHSDSDVRLLPTDSSV